MLTSDGASVMLRKNNGVAAIQKCVIPHLCTFYTLYIRAGHNEKYRIGEPRSGSGKFVKTRKRL